MVIEEKMAWIKRTIVFALVMIPITVLVFLSYSTIVDDEKCFRVEGKCVDTYYSEAYGGKRLEITSKYIVMDSGVHYHLVWNASDIDSLKNLKGEKIAFFACDNPFSETDKAFAFDLNNPEENEKQIKSIRKSCIAYIISLPIFFGILVAVPVFGPECLRAWKRHEDREYKKDMLKRREQKRAKRQRQAEKYSPLEVSTEERHIQNKNMSRKKQKRRMKQNKPSNKTK